VLGRPDTEGTTQVPEVADLVVDTTAGKTPEPVDSLHPNEEPPSGHTGIENHEGTIAVVSVDDTWKALIDSCLWMSEVGMGKSGLVLAPSGTMRGISRYRNYMHIIN
jgi:hypothetical protein